MMNQFCQQLDSSVIYPIHTRFISPPATFPISTTICHCQDVGEGKVKIRLYEGRVSRGPLRATCLIWWLAFRDDGKYSAADYAKIASETVSRDREGSSWNPFEQGLTTKRRRNFIIKMLQGVVKGLAYLHDHNRLHQSLGPFSVILITISEREGSYLIPRLRDLAFSVNVRYTELDDSGQFTEGLWRRASGAGAFTQMEKRAFGIADDIYEAGLLFAYMAFVLFCEAGVMDSLSLQRLLENIFQLDLEATREYCLADDRLVNAVEFLDLGAGAGAELLQAMLNADFRKRPTAEAVLNHRFMTGAVL
ncbi:hypothetical protein GLYMA_01G233100v4 [Glycine max]|uniref:Protein kinase domain-containing protein n=3 Tax=Glycine subgen. Soja TaxID=1462606 RepID=I1JAM6_SOYBN|nr:uncharacterized protein LOC100805144 [Glycine max]XP_028180121.1 uncharacterized protein LOC114367186 [Glycine soja]KAG5070351.1 hypothetical protein JHK85_002728 [Glycine max]KAH1164354.1 hypothetical protein GYH30_002413 [Glycine max]KAH1267728.1 hypothetical protein GmHk_01G002883 [Glycine max]KRH77767.1 hypothetical protein GLYMA_01G233100v4 [Glycine max]RZC31510.1 hypothetical protein D0Y65_002408 [Glycine soja]|eukprot:XP_003516749.2 uncharacterized protein LOC100805144 [Glycine max]